MSAEVLMATPMMITKLENGIKRTGFVLHFYFFPCFVRVFCFPACGPLALHIISLALPLMMHSPLRSVCVRPLYVSALSHQSRVDQ